MNYSKQFISELGSKTGFINSNIEKAVRLLDVLQFIDKELDPQHTKLVLKGGTAINLIFMNLPRLSVDIDLDYIGSLDKDIASKERELIMDSLDSFMAKEGYNLSNKSRGSKILASRTYSYINAFGNRDNVKVEINFIDRVHILNPVVVEIEYFYRHVLVNCPIKEELFGMKICALIDRGKPRDLYDVKNIMALSQNLNVDWLRKSTLFYLSLDGIFIVDENTFNGIKAISQNDIKRELVPVLSKGDRFNLEETKEEVIEWLKHLLSLSNDEKKYFKEFSKGNYNPSLLFDFSCAKRIENHPMARWRISNLQK
jgi:predicted nucleotidyltransferase component of viral defense system